MPIPVVGQSGKTVEVASMADVSGEVQDVPVATVSTAGTVIVGSNLSVSSNGTISIPAASPSVFGVVKTGSNIRSTDGTLSVPTASKATAGVVKAGANMSFAQDGTINPYSVSANNAGIVSQISAIADLTAAPTMDDFNNLLAGLRSSGILASS